MNDGTEERHPVLKGARSPATSPSLGWRLAAGGRSLGFESWPSPSWLCICKAPFPSRAQFPHAQNGKNESLAKQLPASPHRVGTNICALPPSNPAPPVLSPYSLQKSSQVAVSEGALAPSAPLVLALSPGREMIQACSIDTAVPPPEPSHLPSLRHLSFLQRKLPPPALAWPHLPFLLSTWHLWSSILVTCAISPAPLCSLSVFLETFPKFHPFRSCSPEGPQWPAPHCLSLCSNSPSPMYLERHISVFACLILVIISSLPRELLGCHTLFLVSLLHTRNCYPGGACPNGLMVLLVCRLVGLFSPSS